MPRATLAGWRSANWDFMYDYDPFYFRLGGLVQARILSLGSGLEGQRSRA